jgi:hypothetical protein
VFLINKIVEIRNFSAVAMRREQKEVSFSGTGFCFRLANLGEYRALLIEEI